MNKNGDISFKLITLTSSSVLFFIVAGCSAVDSTSVNPTINEAQNCYAGQVSLPTCPQLATATTAQQIQIVEGKNICAKDFITLVVSSPSKYLPAFYKLVPSVKATDYLFSATYDRIYKKTFKFSDAAVIADFRAQFPPAAAACTGHWRCPDWTKYVLSNMETFFINAPPVSHIDAGVVKKDTGSVPAKSDLGTKKDTGVQPTIPDLGVNIDTSPIPTTPHSCSSLGSASTAQQVEIVEQDDSCINDFVSLLLSQPHLYIDAFFKLVSSSKATDHLFDVVYDKMYRGTFVFSDLTVLQKIYDQLPSAVAACPGNYRCADWDKWILKNALIGEFFKCPSNLSSMSVDQILAIIPYSGYYCTESIISPLGTKATTSTVSSLLNILATQKNDWARRNGARIIGWFAAGNGGNNAQTLVTSTMKTEVTSQILQRLKVDRSANVLHDLIWILDSYFYPFWDMEQDLQRISADTLFDETLRWRAIAAWGRMIESKSTLISQAELDFIISSLSSDNKWMRAQAAYISSSLRDGALNDSFQATIVAQLQAAWSTETELVAKIFIAKALDKFTGTTLAAELQKQYETENLANSALANGAVIRSGLPSSDLPALVKLLDAERAAFFSVLGAPFNTPVSGDTNSTLTVIIFATRAKYQEYMEGFVGYGANAGGLYLEGIGTLYTYQRTAAESSYTLEELMQHEYGHALQARFLYPGIWGEGNYLDQPKAWADEGMAEFCAGMVFDNQGGYSTSPRAVSLKSICGASYRDLASLLAQRAGYDQSGTWDYPNGWAFTYYLITQQKSVALKLYTAFRNDTYTLSNFESIAGVSISTLQSGWHNALDTWCAALPKTYSFDLFDVGPTQTIDPGYAERRATASSSSPQMPGVTSPPQNGISSTQAPNVSNGLNVDDPTTQNSTSILGGCALAGPSPTNNDLILSLILAILGFAVIRKVPRVSLRKSFERRLF